MLKIPFLTGLGVAFLIAACVALLLPLVTALSVGVGVGIACIILAAFTFSALLDLVCLLILACRVEVIFKSKPQLTLGIKTTSSFLVTLKSKYRKVEFTLRPRPSTLVEMDRPYFKFWVSRSDENQIEQPFSWIPLERGQLSWKSVWIRARFFGGVIQLQFYKACENSQVFVLPNPYRPSDAHERALERSMLSGNSFERLATASREFDALRRYSPGDEPRRIDWKRSARGFGLLVKTYRPETHQKLMIAVDCGRRMMGRVDEYIQLDLASNAAAHLSEVAIDNDDEVGIFAFSDSVHEHIPSRKGIGQRKVLFDALGRLRSKAVDADYALLTMWGGREGRRSLLVVITSLTFPTSVDTFKEALRPLMKKHKVLLVAISDPELNNIANEQARDLEHAYCIATAKSQLVEIEQRLATLQRSGIDCLHSEASKVGAAIRLKYLQLKSVGGW